MEASQLAQAHFEDTSSKGSRRPVLIANLSYSGCNLIAIATPDEITAGEDVILEFEPDDSVELEVLRVEPLTQRAVRLACRFLD